MLTLQTSSRPRAIRPVAVTSTRLGVAWLGGSLAVSGITSAGERTWTCPEPIREPKDLGAALGSMLKREGLTAKPVVLVVAHPQLVQTVLEVPVLPGAAGRRLLQRHWDQKRLLPNAAIWCSEPAAVVPPNTAQMVYGIDRELHDAIVTTFREIGLRLAALVPLSVILSEARPEGKAVGDRVAISLAAIPGGVVISVSQCDGKPLLVRTLLGSASDALARWQAEVRRTQLFVTQHYQRRVEEVWVAAPNQDLEWIQRLAPDDLAVESIGLEVGLGFWAERARSLDAGPRVNLLAREVAEAPRRRRVLRWSRGIGVTVLVLSAALVWAVEGLRRQQLKERTANARQRAQLEKVAAECRQEGDDWAQQTQIISAKRDSFSPGFPAALTGYLAGVLPPELVLTNLGCSKTTNGWRLQLRGLIRTNQESARPVAAFARALSDRPLRMEVTQVRDGSVPPSGTRSNPWSEFLKPPQPSRSAVLSAFEIEGVLR